jgi:CheY-like chemotaxis protein
MATTPATYAPVANPRVLIVDPVPDVVALMKKLLGMKGIRSMGVFRGRDALQHLAEDLNPEVIVMDLLLPDMDGFTLLQTLKAEERYQGIKVVVATAKSFPQDIQRAKDLGVDHYIVEPFRGDQFLDVIQENLNISHDVFHASSGYAASGGVGQSGISRGRKRGSMRE